MAERSDFIQTMLERADDAFNFDSEQRRRCLEDMKFAFVAGHQWDAHLTRKRRNRPCYEFNRIRQLIRRVTGQQLQNKPDIKVRAVEDNDTDLADIYNGLIRNIEVQSHAETAYDIAFQWACGGGYGVLRVVSEYESDDSFDQCLRIKAVMDPLTVYFDPCAREFDRSDMRYAFVTEMIPRKDFKSTYPGKDVVDFTAPDNTHLQRNWWYEDSVRIAEYWWREPYKRKIYLLSDGSVVNAEDFDGIADEEKQQYGTTIQRERTVDSWKVYSCMVSGKEKLTEPVEWPGTRIPIVPQWGDLISIDGEQIFSGMTRFARDSQTIHNFEMSTLIEVLAKMPNSPLMATPKMIEGLKSYYERMGYDDPPVLLYNADPDAPGSMPQRQPIGQFPAAMAQVAAIAGDELKAVTGVYDASIGAQSNETSGRAILARNSQADTANFVYVDNQVKALKSLGEILVEVIPKVYDAQRSIRILGEDMQQKFVEINKPVFDQMSGTWKIENDLSRGKYDVTVTVGKSFDTQRLEIADTAQALSNDPSPLGLLAKYLLIKNLDVPGLDEFKKAARQFLVNQHLLPPGEGDQPPPPPQPDPRTQAQAQKLVADANRSQAEADKTRIETQILVPQAVADIGKATTEAAATHADTVATYHRMIQPPTMQDASQSTPPPQGGFFMPNGSAPDAYPG